MFVFVTVLVLLRVLVLVTELVKVLVFEFVTPEPPPPDTASAGEFMLVDSNMVIVGGVTAANLPRLSKNSLRALSSAGRASSVSVGM